MFFFFSKHHFMLYNGGLQLCIGIESLGPPRTISLDLPLIHNIMRIYKPFLTKSMIILFWIKTPFLITTVHNGKSVR